MSLRELLPPLPRPRQPHPDWCAQGHRCTAHTMPDGEHVSIPEVWQTPGGRVVGTRHLRRDGSDWVEIRHVMPLHGSEEEREQAMRELIAGAHWALDQVTSWQPGQGG